MSKACLDELIREGVVTDRVKFMRILSRHECELTVEMVEAVGYDGKDVYVPINTKDMFVCCTCSKHCTSEYYGECSECNYPRCANCARGDEKHSCMREKEEQENKQNNDDDDG